MRFTLLTLVAASLLATGTSGLSIPAAAEPLLQPRAADSLLTVDTTSGKAQGVYLSDARVYRWLGIPYGEDTSGSARFKPSVLAARRSGVLDASQAAFSCPSVQSASSKAKLAFTGQQIDPRSRWSEDCLKINIWAPESARKGTGGSKPILLWVYGGSHNTGTATIPLYDGANLAQNEDVIVVTFAYRHSIFANPLSDYVTKQNSEQGWNFGLRDLDLALEWMQKNAASFGGDANRITLFGGSSGSTMIDAYSFSHYDKPSRAAGLIISSGAVTGLEIATGTKSIRNFARPFSEWNTVADSLGCGKGNDQKQFECMQQVPMLTLVDAVNAANSRDNKIQFGPTPDGQTWFNDFAARSNQGRFANVPTLIGSNSNEATLFADNPADTVIVKLSDTTFTPPLWTCPALAGASDRARAGVPTWRYLYKGAWEDFTQGYPALGCYHFAECPMVFGTYPAHYLSDPSRAVTITQAQKDVSRWMQGAWASFARDPANGLTQLGWPRYDNNPFGNRLAIIASGNRPNVTYGRSTLFDQAGCSLEVPTSGVLLGVQQNIASLW